VSEDGPLQVEATGETVGEAKWSALRELEKLQPGIDKASVQFQVLSEGERGLLGVGYAPARVIASVDRSAVATTTPSAAVEDEGELAAQVRELLERVLEAIGVAARVEIREDDESLVATVTGRELGLVIGKHGQTIDAIQYLVNAIAWREHGEQRKPVVVDAAGYRERREATLGTLALRSAELSRKRGTVKGMELALKLHFPEVPMRIEDNGDGFNPSIQQSKGLGLRIMHYRAQLIGGYFRCEGGEQGTLVTCRVPRTHCSIEP